MGTEDKGSLVSTVHCRKFAEMKIAILAVVLTFAVTIDAFCYIVPGPTLPPPKPCGGPIALPNIVHKGVTFYPGKVHVFDNCVKCEWRGAHLSCCGIGHAAGLIQLPEGCIMHKDPAPKCTYAIACPDPVRPTRRPVPPTESTVEPPCDEE